MEKTLMWLMIGIGGVIGSIVPSWLGAGVFSLWGIVGSTIGALAGLYFYRRLDM